jgi:hypothetical protein
MQSQADLSQAKYITDREQKLAFVFNQLQTKAASTQAEVLRFAQLQAMPYRSYFITNAVWVKANLWQLQTLAQLPGVAYIFGNPMFPVEESRENPNAGLRAATWGIDKISAPAVWAMNILGNGIVVGGQDTGVEWDLPTIMSKYRGYDAQGNHNHNYNWYDAIHEAELDHFGNADNPCGFNLTEPCDDHGHGTHTVGTMVGSEVMGSQFGVAPAAQWIACRNMERGWGRPSTYLECFEFFLAPTDVFGQNPNSSLAPHVINNSWGCPPGEGCNTTNFHVMDAAVENLRQAGVVVVVSAGNDGPGCSTIRNPAAIFDGSFTVGATNELDIIAGFSSRGYVDVYQGTRMKPNISAPGVNVLSCLPGNNFAAWSGTSMAGPHVAGAVALLLQAKPYLAGNVEAIETLLEVSADTLLLETDTCSGQAATRVPNHVYGHGRLNIEKAINTDFPCPYINIWLEGNYNDLDVYWLAPYLVYPEKFVVERSSNNIDFNAIGEVLVDSSFNYAKIFSLIDEAPLVNGSYYRIKGVSKNGSFVYSNVAFSFIQHDGWLSPNPNDGFVRVKLPQSAKPMNWQLFSSTGQLVKSFTFRRGGEIHSMNLTDLPQGVYIWKAFNEDVKESGQMIRID